MSEILASLSSFISREGTGQKFTPTGAVITDNPATAGIDESRDPVYFPCPADPALGPGDVNFGNEVRDLNTG